MATQSVSPDLVRFEDFELDLRTGELRRKGALVKLPPQPSKVLVLLVNRAGQVVTRQEIVAEVWGSETFVDFEQGLNFAIRQIRSVLADDADHPRFLETLPKRGYRFAAPVNPLIVAVTEEPALPVAPPTPVAKTTWRYMYLLLAVAVVIAVLLARRSYFQKTTQYTPTSIHYQSLAVLPLHNLSADPKQEYFSEGMTDELITDLAKFGKLRVISHTSVERYKETKMPLPEIARELRVDAIVEGSVTRSGDRVRITAQLIDAHTDQHIWAQSYERDFKDVLSLQDDVARKIATEIGMSLSAGDQARMAHDNAVDPVAHEAYLKGNFYWNQMSCSGYEKALSYFQQAVEKDPNFALAYLGLSDTYFHLADWGCRQQEVTFPKAKIAALKAEELDPTLAEAHSTLAEYAFYREWDWTKAEQEFKRSLELDPNDAESRLSYAKFLIALGKKDEGLSEMKKAHELDPVSETGNMTDAYLLYLTHEFDQAIAQGKKTLELYPNSGPTYHWIAESYEAKKMYDESIADYLKAKTLGGVPADQISVFQKAYQQGGMRGYYEQQLKVSRSQSLGPCWEMLIYRRLLDKDRTLQLLDRGIQQHCDGLQFLKIDPVYDNLRDDPRFNDLLARMRL